jgi:hypothetical protein
MTKLCSICGSRFDGYGHNAEPINDGRCCDDCNATRVVPERVEAMLNSLEPPQLVQDRLLRRVYGGTAEAEA